MDVLGHVADPRLPFVYYYRFSLPRIGSADEQAQVVANAILILQSLRIHHRLVGVVGRIL